MSFFVIIKEKEVSKMKKHITITEEVAKEIKKTAKKEKKTFSLIIELALRYYFKEVKGVEIN